MANVVKVVAGAAKAMRGKKNSKGLKATQYKEVEKLTTGKAKAITRNTRVKEFMDPTTKGKNKNWAKNANKTTLPSATKSRRASIKEASTNTRFEKHPLVRNAGEAASESKYRGNRGKSVPVKKKGK
jgi:hypothetical protein